jgi:hypothetical protein
LFIPGSPLIIHTSDVERGIIDVVDTTGNTVEHTISDVDIYTDTMSVVIESNEKLDLKCTDESIMSEGLKTKHKNNIYNIFFVSRTHCYL